MDGADGVAASDCPAVAEDSARTLQDFSGVIARKSRARYGQPSTLGRVLHRVYRCRAAMSKRNSEGEVLSNKIAVGLAQFQQRQFAALFGDSTPPAAESHESPAEQASIADLKGDGEDEGCVPQVRSSLRIARLTVGVGSASGQLFPKMSNMGPSQTAYQPHMKSCSKI